MISRVLLTAGLGWLVTSAACGASRPATPRRLPSGYIAATRSGPECDSIVERASFMSAADTVGLQRARLTHLFVMPMPVPREIPVMVVNASMRVDTRGYVNRDSTVLTGVPPGDYRVKVLATIAQYIFLPAVLNGCAVSSRVAVKTTFRRAQ